MPIIGPRVNRGTYTGDLAPQRERKVTEMRRKASTAVILLLLTISVAGCFSSNPEDIKAFMMPHKVNVTTETYILQPPDEIEVHCSNVPEIDLQRQQGRVGRVARVIDRDVDMVGSNLVVGGGETDLP